MSWSCDELTGSHVYLPEVVYTVLPVDCVHDSQSATDNCLYMYSIVFVFLLCPQKTYHFFLYIPHKKPFNDKV